MVRYLDSICPCTYWPPCINVDAPRFAIETPAYHVYSIPIVPYLLTHSCSNAWRQSL